jgi:superfamily II DNA or RNA helicase
MTEILKIAANANVAKLHTTDRAVKAFVSNLLSYLVQGSEFMESVKGGTWNGRTSFYSHATSTFPAGFVHLVHNELVAKGHKVMVIKTPAPEPLGVENPIVDAFGNDDERYDFQLRALKQVEKHKRGIIQVATGGGKSKIAKLIAARYRRMTLFITTRGILMYQMKEGFESAGFNVGVVGDGVWAPRKGINVGMVQTLVAQLEEPDLNAEIRNQVRVQANEQEKAEKKGLPFVKLTRPEMVKIAEEIFARKTKIRARTMKLLELVEVVIGEEAHEAGGNSYYQILRHCKNAHIRVALTATPFMRDGAEDNMRLMAAFGPILIKVSEKQLIDLGILATPYFRFVDSKPHDKLRRTSPWQRAYQLGYVENPFMLEDVIRDARLAKKYGLPIMCLILRKDHGKIILEAMQRHGIRARFLQGENNQVERKAALQALGAGEIDALIGTTILDVGVDVPAVSLVQLAGGGKAEVALRQRIGRGLRAKKGVNATFIADYAVGPLNSHLREHAALRRAIIEDTPGFGERILAAGKDFPWALFDSSRKAA